MIIYEASFTFLMHASSKQPSHLSFTALSPISCALHLAMPPFPFHSIPIITVS